MKSAVCGAATLMPLAMPYVLSMPLADADMLSERRYALRYDFR